MVLSIIRQRTFFSEAVQYGIDNEQAALKEYVAYQRSHGHSCLAVSPSGFFASPEYPFLGATPDGAVYDPSDITNPLVFLKYNVHIRQDPSEACNDGSFCCYMDSKTSTPTLKRSHSYYCQIQGQMAIGERPWCDFVVYTKKGIHIEFNEAFWKDELLPKLRCFYYNCVAPELASPMHALARAAYEGPVANVYSI